MGSLLFWWVISVLEHEEYIPQVSPNQKEAWNFLEAAAPFYLSNFIFNYNQGIKIITTKKKENHDKGKLGRSNFYTKNNSYFRSQTYKYVSYSKSEEGEENPPPNQNDKRGDKQNPDDDQDKNNDSEENKSVDTQNSDYEAEYKEKAIGNTIYVKAYK